MAEQKKEAEAQKEREMAEQYKKEQEKFENRSYNCLFLALSREENFENTNEWAGILQP